MNTRGYVAILLCVIGCINVSRATSSSNFGSLSDSTNVKKDSTTEDKPTHFTISTTAGSNLIRNGKMAASQMAYITPSFTYSFESGLYASLSANYLSDTSAWSFDNIGFGVGYSHTFGDHFAIDLGYSYEHYYSTAQVTSSEANSICFTTSWTGKALTPSIGVNYSFGQNHDFTTSFGLSHTFTFKGVFGSNDELSIPISAGVVAGTSNFYKEYVREFIVKHPSKAKGRSGAVTPGKGNAKNGKGTTSTTTTTDTTTTDTTVTTVTTEELKTAYGLNSICFGVGVTYTVNHFSISSVFNYIKSTNNPTSVDVYNAPNISLGVSYSF
jgi:hypothetical protein